LSAALIIPNQSLVAARTKRSLAGWHLFYFMKEHQVDRVCRQNGTLHTYSRSARTRFQLRCRNREYTICGSPSRTSTTRISSYTCPLRANLLTMLFGLAVSSWSTMFKWVILIHKEMLRYGDNPAGCFAQCCRCRCLSYVPSLRATISLLFPDLIQ
jgi:hypothetical protein